MKEEEEIQRNAETRIEKGGKERRKPEVKTKGRGRRKGKGKSSFQRDQNKYETAKLSPPQMKRSLFGSTALIVLAKADPQESGTSTPL